MTLACGVDVGGTKALGVLLDPSTGKVLAEDRVPTPRGGDAIADAVAGLIRELARAAPAPVVAAGLGVAGLVDRSGTLRVAPNLPGVADYPFAAAVHDRVGLPVTVDNDATCATWGEHEAGAARGHDDAVLVTLGTGIGAGIVAGGRLQRGAAGFAGEAGHMVVDPDGPPCPCGRRGCWERFASGSGLGRLAREAALAGRAERVVELAGGDAETVRGEHVTAAARAGDKDALEVFRQFGWWVALGVANLVNLLDPSIVVIGGGLVGAGDLVMDPTREFFGSLVMAHGHRPPVAIVDAELGERAGAIGAASLAARAAAQ